MTDAQVHYRSPMELGNTACRPAPSNRGFLADPREITGPSPLLRLGHAFLRVIRKPKEGGTDLFYPPARVSRSSFKAGL